jgi:hypothetical protein
MWLIWEVRGHSRIEEVPEEDAVSILTEIRERQSAYERQALAVLTHATGESRRYPRRHMTFSLVIVLPIAIMIIALIIWLLGGFR